MGLTPFALTGQAGSIPAQGPASITTHLTSLEVLMAPEDDPTFEERCARIAEQQRRKAELRRLAAAGDPEARESVGGYDEWYDDFGDDDGDDDDD